MTPEALLKSVAVYVEAPLVAPSATASCIARVPALKVRGEEMVVAETAPLASVRSNAFARLMMREVVLAVPEMER